MVALKFIPLPVSAFLLLREVVEIDVTVCFVALKDIDRAFRHCGDSMAVPVARTADMITVTARA